MVEKNNKSVASYYGQSRQDILDLVPTNAHSILEFGCGYGSLGKSLKARQNCYLHGVEINPRAADHLKDNYEKFWIADIENFSFVQLNSNYDSIIFPDVLEHLTNPWSVLDQSVNHLSCHGCIVTSIPNIRNFAVIFRLLVSGSWDYEPYGILDKTHLRFFTKSTIVEMFENAGLEIEEIRVNKDKHKGLKAIVSKVAEFFIADINVCQYLIKAKIKNA